MYVLCVKRRNSTHYKSEKENCKLTCLDFTKWCTWCNTVRDVHSSKRKWNQTSRARNKQILFCWQELTSPFLFHLMHLASGPKSTCIQASIESKLLFRLTWPSRANSCREKPNFLREKEICASKGGQEKHIRTHKHAVSCKRFAYTIVFPQQPSEREAINSASTQSQCITPHATV